MEITNNSKYSSVDEKDITVSDYSSVIKEELRKYEEQYNKGYAHFLNLIPTIITFIPSFFGNIYVIIIIFIFAILVYIIIFLCRKRNNTNESRELFADELAKLLIMSPQEKASKHKDDISKLKGNKKKSKRKNKK